MLSVEPEAVLLADAAHSLSELEQGEVLFGGGVGLDGVLPREEEVLHLVPALLCEGPRVPRVKFYAPVHLPERLADQVVGYSEDQVGGDEEARADTTNLAWLGGSVVAVQGPNAPLQLLLARLGQLHLLQLLEDVPEEL